MALVGQRKYVSSPQEWEDIYERFLSLYETCELKEVVEKLKSHGFYATDNQYKKQITKWQKERKLPPKHIKRSESEFMIQKRRQRESEGQKDTLFLYNGWKMPNEKINHLKNRYHMDDSLPTSPPETPCCISHHTPSISHESTPEAVNLAPFRSYSISFERPWEHFVAQMILNHNVDFTIRIEQNKKPDPMSLAAQASSGSALHRVFKQFREMPTGASVLKLPPLPSSVVQPSLLSLLEDQSLIHGIPQGVLHQLSHVARHYPSSPPDSDFEIDLLTSRMKWALNLNEPHSDTKSDFDVLKSQNTGTEDMFEFIQDLPASYRSQKLSSKAEEIHHYFAAVKSKWVTQTPSSIKIAVIRRGSWQLVRLLLRLCESNGGATFIDIWTLLRLTRVIFQSYAPASTGTERVQMIGRLGKADAILVDIFENLTALTKALGPDTETCHCSLVYCGVLIVLAMTFTPLAYPITAVTQMMHGGQCAMRKACFFRESQDFKS
ncbi:hypothetical protein V2W45_1269997, partial [Cenococcum geophilum]